MNGIRFVNQVAARNISLSTLLALLVVPATAQTYSVNPTSLAFGKAAVGINTQLRALRVTNTGSTPLTLTSYSLSPSEFKFSYGWAPVTLTPNTFMDFGIVLFPDLPQTFNGQLILNFQNAPSVTIPLSGTGVTVTAASTVSTQIFAFPDTPAGTTSTVLSGTLTNTGRQNTTIASVYIDPPFELTTPVITPLIVKPGQVVPFTVALVGTIPGTYTDTLVFNYSNIPSNGVSLRGNVVAASSLGPSSFPLLSFAVPGSPYLATLTAAGGTPPYSWSLASSSTLPAGLTLSPSGVISGTPPSNLAPTNYPFAVNVTDAASNSFTSSFTLPVKPQTGASCNNISVNISGTTTPIVPLNDLGTGTYFNNEGGLYPNGSNQRPPASEAAGVSIAQTIQPLDINGNPDSVNGRIGLMSIGPSILFDDFGTFTLDYYADPTRNTKIVMVPGAQPRAYNSSWADPNSPLWNPIFQSFLPQAGISAAQVQVVYFKDGDPTPAGIFPGDMSKTQTEYETIMQNIRSKFPNVKIVYLGAPVYAGYSAKGNTTNPEPFAFEGGFAVKWAIQDQINGNTNLNWDPNQGPVLAPWMTWGGYFWANGLINRSDGLAWSCPDFRNDGEHQSLPYGRQQEAAAMLNFFRTDTTATPWFIPH